MFSNVQKAKIIRMKTFFKFCILCIFIDFSPICPRQRTNCDARFWTPDSRNQNLESHLRKRDSRKHIDPATDERRAAPWLFQSHVMVSGISQMSLGAGHHQHNTKYIKKSEQTTNIFLFM